MQNPVLPLTKQILVGHNWRGYIGLFGKEQNIPASPLYVNADATCYVRTFMSASPLKQENTNIITNRHQCYTQRHTTIIAAANQQWTQDRRDLQTYRNSKWHLGMLTPWTNCGISQAWMIRISKGASGFCTSFSIGVFV